MNTLVIYDNEGVIIQQITGSYRVPVGIPYIEIEIPSDKILKSVNPETNEPVFEDFPKTETQLLNERLMAAEEALLQLVLEGGGL